MFDRKKHLQRLADIKKKNHPKVEFVCEICNAKFKVYPSRVKWGNPRYCSRKCQNNSPDMKEHSRKNGKKNKGKRLKEKNGNWKGGISDFYNIIRTMDRMRKWVQQVFSRDKYICQKCGDSKGRNLNAHHIIPLNEIVKINNLKTVTDVHNCKQIWEIKNGITLCVKCHRKEHKK